MKLKQVLVASALAATAAAASADVVLSEGFDNVSTLAGAGWVQRNESAPLGATNWFQGNDGVFSAADGAANSYVAANFENGGAPGVISNWLFTPELTLGSITTLAFKARTAGAGFLDTIEVYFSGSGASTTTGDFSLVGSYSSSTDEGWLNNAIDVASAAATGRFAFRYFVANTSIDGNYVGIDSVAVRTAAAAVPVPATWALAGLALLGMGALRRRAA